MNITIICKNNWTEHKLQRSDCIFKGYININGSFKYRREAAQHISDACFELSDADIAKYLNSLDGHYAIVCKWHTGGVFAAVDRLRTTPITYAHTADSFILGDSAPRILELSGSDDPDIVASLEFAMAGYTLGRDTIYKNVKQLQAGEFIKYEPTNGIRVIRYWRYSAWNTDDGLSRKQWVELLSSNTKYLFEQLVNNLGGRAVALPLSGGLDSRLIASGLKHIGYDNVICYAYGLKGNYEAAVSKEVAGRLGYKWHFIEYTVDKVRRCVETDDYQNYLRWSDTLCAVPFIQDFLAVQELTRNRLVPQDSIFINGNSGDFISGGHIPKGIYKYKMRDEGLNVRGVYTASTLARHFQLWEYLKTERNLTIVTKRLSDLFNEDEYGKIDRHNIHGIYECFECESRQAKFVIPGQRVYEHFGYDWHLPLWDKIYTDFWCSVPIEFKAEQNLYIEFLKTENWGRVWSGIDDRRKISPAWVRYLRPAVKLITYPFGDKFWRKLDKHVFLYFTENLCSHANVPVAYSKYLFDMRGFRHSLSFRCEKYLFMKGRNSAGEPVISP